MDIDPDDEEMILFWVLTIVVIAVEKYHKLFLKKQPYRLEGNRGWIETERIIGASDRTCREIIRMSRRPFFTLCQRLQDGGLLYHTNSIRVEEQVVMFLFTIAHNVKNRVTKLYFGHSSETVSRYLNKVLHAILKLYPVLLTPPSTTTNEKILNNLRSYYPYFKNCIGAIDGSHVPAWVPVADHCRFHDRKGLISQNILAACDHDRRFTYILSDWEGSASDSRILEDAIHRQGESKLVVPTGKFYLVDAGFANRTGFLRPYRNVRYHLNEWKDSNLSPTNKQELFNLRHSNLRSVIERAFSNLKLRFKILKAQTEYPFRTQVKIVQACVLLHNHILTQHSIEEEDEWLDADERAAGLSSSVQSNQQNDDDDEVEDDYSGEALNTDQLREEIADNMWVDWMTGDMDDEETSTSVDD
ncbi:putative nuclease HARBI1 [Telopea speciosissima]|uniref:putative nuclease HARBI1 n=1 Tax=Telopea speciosissima TaxID=54955 RepID=UPI001CC3E400|nr:putative nuclease HARBI1 [Telopea speciosissima]